METYTFLSNKGDYVTVNAVDEPQARARAMAELWGPIQFSPEWLGKRWVGKGLMLIKGGQHEG